MVYCSISERARGRTHARAHTISDKIQTPAHWNLSGRSITAPSPMLSPSSALPPPSSQCAVQWAIQRALNNTISMFFYLFKKLRCSKWRNLILRNSEVCVTNGYRSVSSRKGEEASDHDGGSYISKIRCLECVELHLNVPKHRDVMMHRHESGYCNSKTSMKRISRPDTPRHKMYICPCKNHSHLWCHVL
jgi:hypothetical protein